MKPTRSNFYHKCDINTPPSDYNTVIDDTITTHLCRTFEPDIFQKYGFYWVEKSSDVFVTAHTSSGKTLIAEYGILKHLSQPKGSRKRVVYTSPIKTLSNQKFYEFSIRMEEINRSYGQNSDESWDPITVGIITGDTQIRPTADLLIVTTEILRNYLYNKADVIKNLACVIFDEVHYLNDRDRGVVWEECLILLSNKHMVCNDDIEKTKEDILIQENVNELVAVRQTTDIQLILLSATIGNPLEICKWLGNLKQSIIYLITTSQRIIPLDYKILRNGCVYDLTGTYKS